MRVFRERVRERGGGEGERDAREVETKSQEKCDGNREIKEKSKRVVKKG